MGTHAGVDGLAGDELQGDSASPSRDHYRSPLQCVILLKNEVRGCIRECAREDTLRVLPELPRS